MVTIVGALIFVVSLAGGVLGGRRIAGSIAAPLLMTVLQIASSYSDHYALPSSTAGTAVFGWLAGVLIWLMWIRDKQRAEVAASEDGVPTKGTRAS